MANFDGSMSHGAVAHEPDHRVGWHRSHAVVGLVVLALIAGACSRSGGSTQTQSTTSVLGTTLTAKGLFGTMTEPVCGQAPSGETNKATEQGVTADSIDLGTISDVGFSGAPGLNQELWDASQVFADWCNSLGGINGRKINIDKLDAALFNYNQVVTQACAKDFTLVGGGGVFDDTGQKTRLSCLLPDFAGFLVTPAARGADLTVQVTPGPNNSLNFGVARFLKEKYPSSIDHVGYLTGNVQTTITNKNQYEEAAKTFGMKTVYDAQYAATGESTWVPIAQAIQQAGVKGLYFVGEPQDFGLLIAALAQINYKLDWISAAANQYDPKTLVSAGNAVISSPVYVGIGTAPFQAADKVKAVKDYQTLFNQFLPSSTRKNAALGMNSFSAWLLFAQAAKACGADLTRKCVYDNARKVTSWEAGGLQAPTNPSDSNTAGDCMAIMLATTSGWTQVPWQQNHGLFNCSPANVVALKGNYGTGVKLSDVGKSLSDLN